MIYKLLEIRDNGTRIPVIAISTEQDTSLSEEARQNENSFFFTEGFGTHDVILVRAQLQEAKYDPFAHNSLTMHEAHLYIQQHFSEIPNFSVVDVRVIQGVEDKPARSEIFSEEHRLLAARYRH